MGVDIILYSAHLYHTIARKKTGNAVTLTSPGQKRVETTQDDSCNPKRWWSSNGGFNNRTVNV